MVENKTNKSLIVAVRSAFLKEYEKGKESPKIIAGRIAKEFRIMPTVVRDIIRRRIHDNL